MPYSGIQNRSIEIQQTLQKTDETHAPAVKLETWASVVGGNRYASRGSSESAHETTVQGRRNQEAMQISNVNQDASDNQQVGRPADTVPRPGPIPAPAAATSAVATTSAPTPKTLDRLTKRLLLRLQRITRKIGIWLLENLLPD
ncbi:hypothetical protein HAX54_023321 [Datura stramonium]|uniref:Uncharacterized protein n=1 Tax=Datura stramonium TaxID=4076 RepID=A0ABS8Y984_DATST|nr:hypothetical protein [Datura stramonium]